MDETRNNNFTIWKKLSSSENKNKIIGEGCPKKPELYSSCSPKRFDVELLDEAVGSDVGEEIIAQSPTAQTRRAILDALRVQKEAQKEKLENDNKIKINIRSMHSAVIQQKEPEVELPSTSGNVLTPLFLPNVLKKKSIGFPDGRPKVGQSVMEKVNAFTNASKNEISQIVKEVKLGLVAPTIRATNLNYTENIESDATLNTNFELDGSAPNSGQQKANVDDRGLEEGEISSDATDEEYFPLNKNTCSSRPFHGNNMLVVGDGYSANLVIGSDIFNRAVTHFTDGADISKICRISEDLMDNRGPFEIVLIFIGLSSLTDNDRVYLPGHNINILSSKKNFSVTQLLNTVETHHKSWRNKVPMTNIVWVTPYPIDFVAYNKLQLSAMPLDWGKTFTDYERDMISTAHHWEYIRRISKRWTTHMQSVNVFELHVVMFAESKTRNDSHRFFSGKPVEEFVVNGVKPSERFREKFKEMFLQYLSEKFLYLQSSQSVTYVDAALYVHRFQQQSQIWMDNPFTKRGDENGLRPKVLSALKAHRKLYQYYWQNEKMHPDFHKLKSTFSMKHDVTEDYFLAWRQHWLGFLAREFDFSWSIKKSKLVYPSVPSNRNDPSESSSLEFHQKADCRSIDNSEYDQPSTSSFPKVHGEKCGSYVISEKRRGNRSFQEVRNKEGRKYRNTNEEFPYDSRHKRRHRKLECREETVDNVSDFESIVISSDETASSIFRKKSPYANYRSERKHKRQRRSRSASLRSTDIVNMSKMNAANNEKVPKSNPTDIVNISTTDITDNAAISATEPTNISFDEKLDVEELISKVRTEINKRNWEDSELSRSSKQQSLGKQEYDDGGESCAANNHPPSVQISALRNPSPCEAVIEPTQSKYSNENTAEFREESEFNSDLDERMDELMDNEDFMKDLDELGNDIEEELKECRETSFQNDETNSHEKQEVKYCREPKETGNNFLEILRVLNNISNQFGLLSVTIREMYEKAKSLLEAGRDPLSLLTKNNIAILEMIYSRVSSLSEDPQTPEITKSLYMLTSKELRMLLDVPQHETDSFLGINLVNIAKATLRSDTARIIGFIKNTLLYHDINNADKKDIMRIFMAVKAIQLRLLEKLDG